MIDYSLQDAWVYFSDLVTGYVERNGRRGMRDRNAALLGDLRKAGTPGRVHAVKGAIVENNLPLARYVAEKWGWHERWDDDAVEEAYQECCLSLALFLEGLPEQDPLTGDPAAFQMRIYSAMSGALSSRRSRKTFENVCPTVPLDEERLPDGITEEAFPAANREVLLDVVRLVPAGRRNKEIFRAWLCGDEERYIEPGNVEDIAYAYDLSRGTVHLTVNKMLKKTAEFVKKYLFRKEGCILRTEDFFS